MKKLPIIVCFSILFFSACTQRFEHLSEANSQTESLLKKIEPAKSVQYWQVEYFPNHKTEALDTEVIFSKGNYPSNTPISIKTTNFSGFFSGCQPSYCSYKITYFENGEWKMIRSEEALKTFIHTIDNVYEAYLIGKIDGYLIDSGSEKGNGFRKEDNGFKLTMMKYESCPESKESFTLFVTENGTIQEVKSNGFYMKTKDCIVY